MALADTGKAIGAVSQMLQDHLLTRLAGTVANIQIGRPEASGNGVTNPRLNLFLYEIQFDPSLRNRSLDDGQPTPLWLVLKYLLTAFDEDGDSDSTEAHGFLGEGMRALQELSFLPLSGLTPDTLKSLSDNPEALKITFDQTPSDLLAKLMQASDEDQYRCSVSFEVRPVMIATGKLPSYSLLVGVDYLANTLIGEKGVQVAVVPSMGPTITAIAPEKFEVGTTLTIRGRDLDLSALAVQLGSVELPTIAQSPAALQCQVNGSIADGTAISAGSHAMAVIQILPGGRRRSSNLLIAHLLPTLAAATPNALARVPPADPTSNVFGNIDLTGVLLGTAEDDVFVALYRDGRTVRVFDELVAIPPPPPPPLVTPQTQMRLQIGPENAVPPGKYRVILRVNGQQARNSPEVELVVL